MSRFRFFVFILAAIELRFSNSTRLDRYKAAVVEYRSIWNSKESPCKNVLVNAQKYSEIIGIAAKYETDIIVFPAHGLLGHNFIEIARQESHIPDDNETQDKVLQIISKAAQESSIYVVINFVENLNMSIYSTNFIFDRNGTIISRYRKFNRRLDYILDDTEEAEITTFDTDFGVKFGTFVDLDIMFEYPSLELVRQGIRDFVYPTAWFNEFPFLTAIQAQWSWSYANDVNLLAANLNDIERGSCGSGLHRGRKIKSLSNQTIFEGSFMLIGNIPKYGYPVLDNLNNDDVIVPLEVPTKQEFFAYKDEINVYKTQLLNISLTSKVAIFENGTKVGYNALTTYNTSICEKEFCCFFNTTFTSTYLLQGQSSANYMTSFDKFRYRYLIFNGRHKFRNIEHFGLQLCAIAPCINESKSSCFNFPHENEHFYTTIDGEIYFLNATVFNSINITATFINDAVILPNIFETSHLFGTVPDPNELIFISSEQYDGKQASIVFNSKNLISIGLWGRIFSGDTIPETEIVPYLLGGSFLLLCMLVSLVCSCRKYQKPKNMLQQSKNVPTFRFQFSFGHHNDESSTSEEKS